MPRGSYTDYSALDRLDQTLRRGTESFLRATQAEASVAQQIAQRTLARQRRDEISSTITDFEKAISPRRVARLRDVDVPLGTKDAVESMVPPSDAETEQALTQTAARLLRSGAVPEANVIESLYRSRRPRNRAVQWKDVFVGERDGRKVREQAAFYTDTGEDVPNAHRTVPFDQRSIDDMVADVLGADNKPIVVEIGGEPHKKRIRRDQTSGRDIPGSEFYERIVRSSGDGDGSGGRGVSDLFVYDDNKNPIGIAEGVTAAQIGVAMRSLEQKGEDLDKRRRNLDFQYEKKAIDENTYTKEKDFIDRELKYLTAHEAALRKRAKQGKSEDEPKVDEPKELDEATAAKILEEAGGDPDKATEIAKKRGYKVD